MTAAQTLRTLFALVPFFTFAVGVATAANLNDTGITICEDDNGPANCATAGADGGTAPRQDGMFVKPFDFTKIAHDGSELPMSATFGGNNPSDWACTRDNVTQLIWEIKTYAIWPKFPGLRDVTHTYTWYNSDPATNGGAVGKASNGICFKTGRCDTEKYVADVNAQGLCGASDWRMPSVKEFESLSALTWTSDFGLNPDFFPNISLPSYRNHLLYLTGSPRAGDTTDMVWTINGLGMANNIVKTFPASVRLVRSAKR